MWLVFHHESNMRHRRTFLASVGAAVAGVAGCLGPSGGDSDNESENGEESEGPPGEIAFEEGLSDSISVERSARFEDAAVDQTLIVEGTVTNDGGDNTLSVVLTLNIEQFRRNDSQTVEIGPGESAEFEVSLNSVYAEQFDGYTLDVTTDEG